jgi:peptidoglycan hydrolase CwlO-like protein
LRATEEDVQIQIGQLNDAQSKAEAKANDLNDRKSQASAAASEQRKLLDQAKGELATLVAQAQAKKAAAEAAAAVPSAWSA